MRRVMLVLLFISGFLCESSADACTTIIVGKGATVDGSIIIARNEDTSGSAEAHAMFRHPERKESAVFKSNSIDNSDNNAFECTLPKNALAYTSFPFWQTITKRNHSYEEAGINAYGVAMSATETIFNSTNALKADPYNTRTGLIEDSVTSIVLPYATSAREGVRILGGYVEKVGAGEGFGVAFLDSREAWYFETASGHHWLAQRIPDNAYFVSANQGRFQSVDISDTMNVMSSPGLVEFAAANGLYDPQSGPFNFFQAYISDTEHDKTYNYPRVRELLRIYSTIDYPRIDGLYPVFVEPKKKLSVRDVARGLRNRYEGTAHDPYQNKNPKEPYRPISVIRTSLSHIIQSRQDMPSDIATVQFIAFGMTELSAYIPFHKGLTEIPKEYQTATDRADDTSVFWKNRKLQALVMQDYPRFAPMVTAAIVVLEKDIARMQERMEKDYLKTYTKDAVSAKRLITSFNRAALSKQDKMISRLTRKIASSLGMENLTDEQFTGMIRKVEAAYHFHGA
jgi:dipeptidase